MRTVRYRTAWRYRGRATKREGLLSDFVLDILYLMNTTGVIPPLAVLNAVLRQGSGGAGGMGPETKWTPFEIAEHEYGELVTALLALDVTQARTQHPYIAFARVVVDDELNRFEDYLEWLRASERKYRHGTPDDNDGAR